MTAGRQATPRPRRRALRTVRHAPMCCVWSAAEATGRARLEYEGPRGWVFAPITGTRMWGSGSLGSRQPEWLSTVPREVLLARCSALFV